MNALEKRSWSPYLVGGFLSSKLSGDRAPGEKIPALWQRRFGPSVGARYGAAFVGGFLLMLGARVAQGCTSGHGILVAFALYGREGSRHV